LKPKLVIIFLLIVLLPLLLLLGLGVRLAGYEQEEVQRQFQKLLVEQLTDIDQRIAQFLEKRQRELLDLTSIALADIGTMRHITRKNAFVKQLFYLDTKGQILYPSPNGQLNQEEWDFLERTKDILIDRNLIYQSDKDLAAPIEQRSAQKAAQQSAQTKQLIAPPVQRAPGINQKKQMPPTSQSIQQQSVRGSMEATGQSQAETTIAEEVKTKPYGWYVWYWGRNTQILFWRLNGTGNIVGAELDSVRLLADVIGLLPSTSPVEEGTIKGRITLVNSIGETLYQWGGYVPGEAEEPLAGKSVCYPLAAWKLRYYLPSEEFGTSGGMYFSLIVALAAVGLALVGLAVYFYRESSREIRQAAQRVSFVNQVSHELKTPLTNIRMYAELMDEGLPGEEDKIQKYLSIIVSESQRLSRLIGNILTFSRKQRNKLTLHSSPGVADEVIQSVLENFRASFETNKIDVTFDGGARQLVNIDRDALEQILGNLFSNVEKYAASGGIMKVESRHTDGQTIITVTDAGPGIPSRQREKIFLPFKRISNKLTDGVSGTGIGLSIARELARLHGGDIVVLQSPGGASFQLTIATPPVSTGEAL